VAVRVNFCHLWCEALMALEAGSGPLTYWLTCLLLRVQLK